MEHIKEKIKLQTEWMRGFFVLFVLDTTSISTILIRQKFSSNEFELDLLISALLLDIIIYILILAYNKKINKLIELLKQ